MMNGIWNVFEYEWRVSNESGETAPSMDATPLENLEQTAIKHNIILIPGDISENPAVLIDH